MSGHATGTASSGNGDLSDGFKTQTSATLTIIYHYIPNLPSLNPPPANTSPSVPSSGSGGAGPASVITTPSIPAKQTATVAKKKMPVHTAISTHPVVKHPVVSHPQPKPAVKSVAVKARPIH